MTAPTKPRLHLSKDRKVSPHGIFQAKDNRWLPSVPNSFGLPAGASCPGRTTFCDACYAVRSEQSQGVRAAMEHNLTLLSAARTVSGMAELLDEAITYFEQLATRRGLDRRDWVFRIHWDGDFFSLAYARAWAQVIAAHPRVQFWAYTRSFNDRVNVVPILVGLDNLALYLSVDQWNVDRARVQVAAHPQVRLAGSHEDFKGARILTVLARGLDGKTTSSINCPENAGLIKLMNDGRGACTDCRVCITGSTDVAFATSRRELVPSSTARRCPTRATPTKPLTEQVPGVAAGKGRASVR